MCSITTSIGMYLLDSNPWREKMQVVHEAKKIQPKIYTVLWLIEKTIGRNTGGGEENSEHKEAFMSLTGDPGAITCLQAVE